MPRKKTVSKKNGPGTAMISMAQLEKQLAKEAIEAEETEQTWGGNSISVAGKRFVVEDAEMPDPLRVIIVAHAYANTWYDAKYDPNNPGPPACFALSVSYQDMEPEKSSPVPQSPNCDECPQNVFGSSDFGRGKACQNGRRLVVMLADDVEDNPTLALLHVSATAIKAYGQYVRGLAKIHKRPPHGVVTDFTFNDKHDFPSLVASMVAPITDPQLMSTVLSKREEAIEMSIQPFDVSGYEAPGKGRSKKKAAKKKTTKKRAARRGTRSY